MNAHAGVRTRGEALAELRQVAEHRAVVLEEADRDYKRMVELYVELRERCDPPVQVKDIAKVVDDAGSPGGSVVAVSAAK